jgi:hypothetical protein
MPDGADFNVLVPISDTAVFVHETTLENIVSYWTIIDHPLTNNNPYALVFATQNWNPRGVGSTFHDHSIGVLYDHGDDRWAIFNQNTDPMPEGVAFNVVIKSHKLYLPLIMR